MNWLTDNAIWLALAFVILGAFTHANNAHGDTSIYAGAWSDHPFSDYDYNETHRLAGVEHKKVFAAYFRNSYDRDSFALGYNLLQAQWHDFEAKVIVGAVRGYRGCYKDSEPNATVCPLAVPLVSYTKFQVQPTLMIVGEAFAFSIRIEL